MMIKRFTRENMHTLKNVYVFSSNIFLSTVVKIRCSLILNQTNIKLMYLRMFIFFFDFITLNNIKLRQNFNNYFDIVYFSNPRPNPKEKIEHYGKSHSLTIKLFKDKCVLLFNNTHCYTISYPSVHELNQNFESELQCLKFF